jgi:hypothetical protein
MNETTFHLIHANIATMRAPFEDPRMVDFVAMVDEIDALAHEAPGFVAQPTPLDEGVVYKGQVLLNLSIWESVESLEQFTYAGLHKLALSRRTEWFTQQPQPNYVLFWMPAGEVPTEIQVARRIAHLSEFGPTPFAFNFDQQFTAQEMLQDKRRKIDG